MWGSGGCQGPMEGAALLRRQRLPMPAAAVQFSACSPVELPRESESAANLCPRMLVLSLLQERASKSDDSLAYPSDCAEVKEIQPATRLEGFKPSKQVPTN